MSLEIKRHVYKKRKEKKKEIVRKVLGIRNCEGGHELAV